MSSESYSGARSPGVSYQGLLDTDTRTVPAVLRLESPKYLGSADVDIAHYISREWHEREVAHLWSRVWQFACREDDIPEVGDHIVYEIARASYFVIRSAPDEIKAYPNACLHRGRRLKDHEGNCDEIRCPFHGFAWALDGALKEVPARWDFEHVADEDFSLPECQVGTWAGFVMINPDPDAEPLADYLGEMPDHFADWDLANRYTQAHVAKVIQANWKIAQEAFCESFHANATHPQILPYIGDTNSQVDVWDNFSRVITPGGTPSPLLDYVPTEDEMMRAMTDTRVDEPTPIPIAEGESMRAVGAASSRERWRPAAGDAVDEMSDAEMMDNIDYTVFPNFHPWGSFNRIVYRFRPNGDDHRSSIMECIFLGPYAGEKPPNAPIHWLGEDETFTDAPELGTLGKVFNQDLFNMPRVQQGLETTRKPGVTLGNYQESKIRWIHNKLDEWCGDHSDGSEQ
ncbi:MAG: phenylpropionate dioxygenase-like ring-hydroxylating dioxygenase large terminal subunit [Candidatus Aldehydirespiratoraceae bacterium]|jgi:phenylpropionate dioxygenase-like ring-hydroxylating dioxygenase large terminal subunit